jgi:hypothetical protein
MYPVNKLTCLGAYPVNKSREGHSPEQVQESKCGAPEGRTADPSASPDFLSQVAASVSYMWFSLERTTHAALVRVVR